MRDIMDRKNEIQNAIEKLLSCKDAAYIDEIYAKEGSFDRNGQFSNWVGLMAEVSANFKNTDLYTVINDIEDEYHDFTLVISVEPNSVERGYGKVLYSRKRIV